MSDRSLRLDGVGPPHIPVRRMPSIPGPAGADGQAAARGDHPRPRPRAVAAVARVAAGDRRRAHRPDQARLGHGVREQGRPREGRAVPAGRRAHLPGRHAAGDRRASGGLDRYVEWLRGSGSTTSRCPTGRCRSRRSASARSSPSSPASSPSSPRWEQERPDAVGRGVVRGDAQRPRGRRGVVIGEGRESGTVGLFDDHGDVHADLVDAIVARSGWRRSSSRRRTSAAGLAAAPPRAERQPRQRRTTTT